MTGRLVRLRTNDATFSIGAFEYQVLVPEFVRRQLQSQLDQEVSLWTIQYLDGNIQKGGRMTPRMVGFLHEAEREFFELFCQVDGVGVKKALQAMIRPVHEVAEAIEEQDVRFLSTLPGIGPAGAERIIAKLRRKMARFALLVSSDDGGTERRADHDILHEGYEALIGLGHTPGDARERIDQAVAAKGKFKSVEELLQQVYQQNRGG